MLRRRLLCGGGVQILLRNIRRDDRKGGKFSQKWLGPFTICEIFNNGTVNLKKSGSPLKTKQNLCNLKAYVISEKIADDTQNQNIEISATRMYSPISKDNALEISKKLGLLYKGKLLHKLNVKKLQNPSKKQRIRGDGNCFFRAISVCLTGTEENHRQLRDKVVSNMCEEPLKTLHYWKNI